MTEEKQQMLSDLYTLRAGLSLISQYGDVVRANERIIENTVEDNDFTKFAKDAIKGYADTQCMRAFVRNIIDRDYTLPQHDDRYKNFDSYRAYSAALDDALDVARAEMQQHLKKYYEEFFELLKNNEYWDQQINHESKCANKSLGLKIFDSYERDIKKRHKEELQHLQQFISKKDDLIRQHEAWLAKNEKSNYENQNAAIAKIKNSQLEITCQQPKIQAVFNALDETFSDQLDKRDWGNVDMIIYFIETNRADSRKEALQLLDRERQTQDIVSAVNNSINWLGNVIKQESQRICGIVGAGFTQLNKRLNDVMNLQYSQMQMQAQQMQMQARQMQVMQKQISQTEFTNALLQKSNESSQKMMDDFYLMKQKYNL